MKKHKQLLLITSGFLGLMILSGCVQTKNGAPTGEGWVYQLLVKPMSDTIHFFAVDQHLGFGIAIMIVTLLVRLLILPIGLHQAYKAAYQSEKMNYLKPVFAPIQERMKTGDQVEKLQAQQELMAAYKEYEVSMFGGIGCLPLLIQMPFFTALFYAARYTDGISQSSFLGIHLGQPNIILVAIVGALYLLQGYLSLTGLDTDQRKQMRSMMYVSPAMIVFISLSSPAGVTLYWVVGGLVSIFQQVLTTWVIRPRLRAKVAEEMKDKPLTTASSASPKKDVTPQKNHPASRTTPGRNAGKQRSR